MYTDIYSLNYIYYHNKIISTKKSVLTRLMGIPIM